MKKTLESVAHSRTEPVAGSESPVGDSEFTYVPVHLSAEGIGAVAPSATPTVVEWTGADEVTEATVLKAVIANDGSFLEKTKALLAHSTSENPK